MPRPKHEYPTPAELEVLQYLWDEAPSTVRRVMDGSKPPSPPGLHLGDEPAGRDDRQGSAETPPKGRAYLYEARVGREKTVGQMLHDLLGRAFDGSAASLVARLLDESSPSPEELAEIRETIKQFCRERGGD